MMSQSWNPDDLVYRQVHPTHAPDGNPSSQAFNPTPKDQKQLSVDDASLVTAGESWSHFTSTLGYKSTGTWAVSCEEIETAGDLTLVKDPLDDNVAHCLIDFSKMNSKGQMKKRAQLLAIKASARGCLFQAPQ
jgi:hypothetical protein